MSVSLGMQINRATGNYVNETNNIKESSAIQYYNYINLKRYSL